MNIIQSIKVTIVSIFLLSSLFPQQFEWEHLKGPNGGIIGEVKADSKGTLFAGVYFYRGLFRSYDGGKTWERLEYAFAEFQVYTIYISPEDHIYVGNNYGHKIYLSTDGGDTWATSSEGYVTNECWTISRTGDSIMTAGDGEFGGIWRSTNRGKNWVRTGELSIKPIDIQATPSGVFLCGSHNGLLRSTDQGLTWQRVSGMQGFAVPDFLIVSDSLIYCGSGYYSNGNGVFKSTDEGVTWQPAGLNNGLIVVDLERFSNGSLVAATKNDGILVSHDDGINWEESDMILKNYEVFRLTVKNDTLYAGMDNGGIFMSVDRAQNFELIGLPISGSNNLLINENKLYASTYSGIQVYSQQEKRWHYDGLFNTPIVRNSPSGTLYSQNGRDYFIYKKDLGSESWLKLTTNADTSIVNDIIFIDDSVIFASALTFQMSSDAGISWKKIAGAVGSVLTLLNETEYLVQLWSNYEGKVYRSSANDSAFHLFLNQALSGTRPNGFTVWQNWILLAESAGPWGSRFLTTDGGNTWKSSIQTGPYKFTMFEIYNGIIFGGGADGVFMSTDAGDTWIQILDLGIYNNVNDIIVHENRIYVATRTNGVYVSSPITSSREYPNPLSGSDIELSAYPNPSNSQITLTIKLPSGSAAQLNIYNSLGELVEQSDFEPGHEGVFRYHLRGQYLSSGVYYCQLISGKASMTRKIVFMK